MTKPVSAADYSIWLCPERIPDLGRSAPAQKLQITITTQQNKKSLLGLPLELRSSIISHTIGHRQENVVFAVDARDARHLADDLSCSACDHFKPGWKRWLSSRRPQVTRFSEAEPELLKYVRSKGNISCWKCRHRLIPNAKTLRLTSRQLNTEIIDFLIPFSNGRSIKLMLRNIVYRMHSVTKFIRQSLDQNALALILIHEQCEYDRPNCHIAGEEGFLNPVLQCIKIRGHSFTSLAVEIVNRRMKLRKLRKILASLKAFKVEQARIRCGNRPVKWKKGCGRVIREVRDAMMEKPVMADADEGSF